MLQKLMQTKAPVYTGAMSAYPYDPKLAEKLTFEDRFKNTFWIFKKSGPHILVPRALCPIADQDMRVFGVPETFPNFKFKPRNDEQYRCVKEAKALVDDDQSFIMTAPTGSGKSVMGCALIAHRQRAAAVVVPKTDLINRWYEECINVLGLKPSEIGVMQQDTFDVAGKKVVLIMLHSLVQRKTYPSWFKQQFGLVIFDEVHRLGADEFQEAAAMFPAIIRVGLSARDERADGREIVFRSHIGPVRIRYKLEQLVPAVLRYRTSWRCPRMKTKDGVKIVPHSGGRDMHIKKRLVKDTIRNRALVTVIKQSYDLGRNIVVFSDMVDMCELLVQLLAERGVAQRDMAVYASSSKMHAGAAGLKARIIAATYGMMAEGTDVPPLDTAVLASPRSDVMQAVGRIRRLFANKKNAVVIDFVDDDSPVFAGYAKSRLKWYESIGCEVSWVSIDEGGK